MRIDRFMPGYRSPDDSAPNPQLEGGVGVSSRDEYLQALKRLRQVADNCIQEITTRIDTDCYADRVTPEEVMVELEAWVEVASQITRSLIHDLLAQQSLMIEEAYEKLEDQAPALSWFQKAANFFRHATSRSHRSAKISETPAVNSDSLTPSEIALARAALADLYNILESVFCKLPDLRNLTLVRAALVTSIIFTLLPTASANAPSSLSTNSHVPSPNQVATATHPDHLSTPLPGYLSHAFTPIPTHTSPTTSLRPTSLEPSANEFITTSERPDESIKTSPWGINEAEYQNSNQPATEYKIVTENSLIATYMEIISEGSVKLPHSDSIENQGYNSQMAEALQAANVGIIIPEYNMIVGKGAFIKLGNNTWFITAQHVLDEMASALPELTSSSGYDVVLAVSGSDIYTFMSINISSGSFKYLRVLTNDGSDAGDGFGMLLLSDSSSIDGITSPLQVVTMEEIYSLFNMESETPSGLVCFGEDGLCSFVDFLQVSSGYSNWRFDRPNRRVKPGDSGGGLIIEDKNNPHGYSLAGLVSALNLGRLSPINEKLEPKVAVLPFRERDFGH